MANKDWQYDLFISYAREDSDWVVSSLHEPLLRSRSVVDGRRPRIFFDVSEEGVAQAANFISALAEAMLNSRRIVCVYSGHYFQKPMCNWELTMALQRHLSNSGQRLVPILIEPEAAGALPFMVTVINYLSTDTPDWFPRLCDTLDLRAADGPVSTAPERVDDVPDTERDDFTPAPMASVDDAFGAVIDAKGAPVFFGRDSVAVLGDTLDVFDTRGHRATGASPTSLTGWRLSVPAGEHLVVAEWSGRVLVAAGDGVVTEAIPASAGFNVPGATVFDGTTAYVAYWGGLVYAIDCGSGEARPILRHQPGVRALAAANGAVYVVGFDDAIAAYRDGRLVNMVPLQEDLLGIRAYGDRVLGIGRANLYHFESPSLKAISEEIGSAPLRSADTHSSVPAVVDTNGRGFRVNADLVRSSQFAVAAGSRVISADDDGRFVVVADRDGAATLLEDGRAVFSNPSGALAVTIDGSMVAVQTDTGVRVDRTRALLDGRGETEGGVSSD